MTRDELKAIEAKMREDIVREAREAGVNVNARRIMPSVRRTAKRVSLLGEFLQLSTSGLIKLDRWAANGVSYEDLKSVEAWISPDRQRKPHSAKIR